MMKAYTIYVKVSGKNVRSDEVVFSGPKTLKQVKEAMIKEGYNPKTLSVKVAAL